MIETIHAAAEALRRGEVTPLDLVEQCLTQIERCEERVRAWVFVDRDGARAEARRLTAELQRGQRRSPLHGIPLGIKDIIDVFDWPTAAGSKRWAHSIARQDADVVRRLRQAGAIFLGKTVTTQYASFDPPVTRNPWNLERTPGGSSSGSAAAVATGMCFAALGSQTGGSITRPASYCGVAALKPTYNLVSTQGVVPLAHSLDHIGPMARCVTDLALLLDAMAVPAQGRPPALVGQTCRPTRTTLYRVHGLFDDLAEPSVRQAFDAVCKRLEARHAALPAGFAEVPWRHRTVMAVEAAEFHRERLARHPDDYQPNVRQLLEEGLACSAAEYTACKTHQQQLRSEFGEMLSSGAVLLTPATTSPAPPAATTGDPAFNSPWSYTGLPTISLPTGQFIDGLPLAVQLVAGPHREEELFEAARWVEHELGVGASPPLAG